MKISIKIALIMSMLLLGVTLVFSAVIYKEKRSDLLNRVDERLYASALFAHSLLGEDYHDEITGPTHFSKEEYLAIIDQYNTICKEQGLQYLWSLMKFDGQLVFTSSTTQGHNVSSGQHALFFDPHSSPDAYKEAFSTMQPQYQIIDDRWGIIRVVLVPFTDVHGRDYLFGASVAISFVDQLIVDTVKRASLISVIILLVGILASILVARTFSKPIIELTTVAKEIAAGHYSTRVELGGSPEIESLSSSINAMSKSIEDTIDALTNSEERLNLALNAANDGLWDWDMSKDKVYFSPRYYIMLGYEPNEFDASYEKLCELIHPEDLGKTEMLIDQGLKKGKSFHAEFRMKMKGGGWIWILSRGRLVSSDQKGRPVRMVGVHTDISHRKEIEAALRQSKHDAEVANKAKTDFLATMSHELRTPLNAMMGMLQLMAKTDLDEDQQEYATHSVEACQRLRDLLGNILDISRIEAGKIKGTEETFDSREFFTAMKVDHGNNAARKGLGFSMYVDEAIPTKLYGHKIRIEQILNNLLSNGVKFTDSGSIMLEAHALPEGKPGTVRILFTVSDSGIGIPDYMLPRIFTAFKQADSPFDRRFQGAGLGLSITKQLIDMMDGSIFVESEENVGSAFHVSVAFRLVETDKVHTATTVEHSLPQLTGRALVVEDDNINRKVLTELLKRTGVKTDGAIDGLEALKMLKKNEYNLVFMDVQMPIMDGLETTKAIRTNHEYQDVSRIPIIGVTAYAMEGDKERFIQAGMTDYVSKPLEAKRLHEILEQYLT